MGARDGVVTIKYLIEASGAGPLDPLGYPVPLKHEMGQYVFLNFPSISKWEWHPYTLASSPLETHYEVDIKILGDLPCPNPYPRRP